MAKLTEYTKTMNEIQACIGALPTEAAALEAHSMWQRQGAGILGAWAGMNGYAALETVCQDFTRMIEEDVK